MSPPIQTNLIAAPEPIPLPALEAPDPDGERRLRVSRWLDRLLVAVVLAFAFLVASFAVRNSDFWLHLATGRRIAEGNYQIGVDPFSHTTAGVRWVNHSWLFDLVLYELHRGLDGSALVILKALLVLVLAGVLLAIRRSTQGYWLPALCTALAILAMSPRLLLQPVLFSYLFLAITLLILAQAAEKPRRLWLLPGLFAVWVNLDAWFILGPVAVALFLLGSLRDRLARQKIAFVLLAGLAACLLNRHHIWAFQLPMEVSPAVLSSGWTDDARFRWIFESPWHLDRYANPAAGLNAAGLAYFVLVGVGLLSFAINRSRLRDWRMPLWFGFALLGAWQLRIVPFFAVVSGPIAALNFQDALARRSYPNITRLELAMRRGNFGRALSFVGGLVLLAVAWPGWLQAFPHDAFRVRWAVQPNPALQLTAQTLKEWSDQGRLLKDERLFVSHPDLGPYVAWYWPEAKGYLDPRLSLFPHLTQEYQTVCRALNPALAGTAETVKTPDWEIILQQRGITMLVLHDNETNRALSPLGGPLLERGASWPLLFVGGKTLVFGRADSRISRESVRLDVDRLAFGVGAAPPRPDVNATGAYPVAPTFTQRYLDGPPAASWESDAASAYVRLFEERARHEQPQHFRERLSVSVAALCASGASADMVPALSQLIERMQHANVFLPQLDDGPAGAALLATQMARRALAANPNDANAWLRLAQAYIHLRRDTRERQWAARFALLDLLRHVQIVTALENALQLEPNFLPAHQTLALVYLQRGYLDAALEHRRAEARLSRLAGPLPGETGANFDKRVTNLETIVGEMERALADRMNQYVIQSTSAKNNPLAQARVALQLGLAQKALDDVLLQSEIVLFGVDGARLELELLLMLGRSARAREELSSVELADNSERLGLQAFPGANFAGYPQPVVLPAYDWFGTLLGAASGDLAGAQEKILAIDLRLKQHLVNLNKPQLTRNRVAAAAGEIAAAARPDTICYQIALRDRGDALGGLYAEIDHLQLLRADVLTVAGLLALENGQPNLAEKRFQQVNELTSAPDTAEPRSAGGPTALGYLSRITAVAAEEARFKRP